MNHRLRVHLRFYLRLEPPPEFLCRVCDGVSCNFFFRAQHHSVLNGLNAARIQRMAIDRQKGDYGS